MSSPDGAWLTIEEAVRLAGCTDGYVRRLLREEKLAGWKAGNRAWLVRVEDVVRLRAELSTRSNLRRHERKSGRAARRLK